jgi:hypothetical protein
MVFESKFLAEAEHAIVEIDFRNTSKRIGDPASQFAVSSDIPVLSHD